MSARIRFCLAFIFLHAAIFSVRADQPFSFASTPGELPRNIVPHHYAIRLEPDLDKLRTRGSVGIDIEVLSSTHEIVLNALDLTITRAILLGEHETDLKIVPDAAHQAVHLKSPVKIRSGKYTLSIEYRGLIGEEAQGLFYVRYPTDSGKKIMIGTEMEPSDARRMFPCWDEPVFRATYDVSVTLPKKFKAVSNMPIISETVKDDARKTVTFGTTPPMSSYLVVLVAGELEEISDEVDGVKIRVITTEGKAEQGRYALDATKKLLTYYNDYFGIKYPLPKLDQIAIPGGFEGAMENWGGITYNETFLLYDPKKTSFAEQREIFVTIAHEMSHQWFGNLVTTAWWNNLWLNEGFATWMEVKATDHFNPDWQMRLSAMRDRSIVMNGDAHPTTHPIQQAVDNESEANDAFDSITYQKGGALLQMLEDYLGADMFRKGVNGYLSTHSYSSATSADLWRALDKASGQPVGTICSGWITQPGLPMVDVQAECVEGKEVVHLKQQRFTIQDQHAKTLRWNIPMMLMDGSRTNETIRILFKDQAMKFSLPDCPEYVKANAGDVGYYRVKYSVPLLSALKNHISELPPADRLNLLDDSWALVEAGDAHATEFLEFAGALHGETSFAVMDEISAVLDLIDSLERDEPGRTDFQEYACSILRPAFARLGWTPKPGENANDALLRAKLILGLGHFGDKEIIAESKKRFADFVLDHDSLPPDLREPVLKIAGRYGDRTIHDQLHQMATNAPDTAERQLYYAAMSCALDPDLALKTLAISLTDESAPQEELDLIVGVAAAGEQPALAWDFAREHLKELMAKVTGFDRNNFVPSIFAAFSDAVRADELEVFVKKNVSQDALMKARQVAEEIRFKAALKKRELPLIDAWIKSHNKETNEN